MGNHCLKKQQTIERSQIFASIPACTRLSLDRHEKVVRQQPEPTVSSKVGQKTALTGMAQADLLQWSQPFLTQRHDALRKPGARPSQSNTEIHMSKLFSHSGNEKPSGLVTAEGCWLPLHAALGSLQSGWIMPQAQLTARYLDCPRLQKGHTRERDQLMDSAFVAY